ncbi:GNAT family N-acetyltransferase [Falsibacillus pallidus]|uniref:GNAT family N-acetyltransferase n=1 Tax=Falsibacillus pallidus TaxID=493781 RepID=UPI003D97F30B
MTNVYTIPEYRNAGIGSKVLSSINKWIKEKKIEFVIVCPTTKLLIITRKMIMFIV